MKLLLLFCAFLFLACACTHCGEDLRAVPVTNNPTLIPKSHLAERPGFVY